MKQSRELVTGAVLTTVSALLFAQLSLAQEPRAEDYALSMAGALISDWCGRQWQEEKYITQHACNYALSQRYDLETSSTDFTECAVANGGDIVKIADCMMTRFNAWIAQDKTRSE